MADFAVFTLTQNEKFFLPIWLRYYVPQFGPEHVYVLDHRSEGDALASLLDLQRGYGFQYLRLEYPISFDDRWLTKTACHFQRFLLESYRYVLFCGVDEIVAPSPALAPTLRDYLSDLQPSLAPRRCYGVEVVEHHEPPLSLDAPILLQRRWGYHCMRYSKPALASVPVLWQPGFSSAVNVPRDPSAILPDLWLFHLHRADFDVCLERHREREQRPWVEGARFRPPYFQNVIVEPDRLRAWFGWHADDTRQYAQLEMLPEWSKGIV